LFAFMFANGWPCLAGCGRLGLKREVEKFAIHATHYHGAEAAS